MIDWDDLRYFLAVERAGTLIRAATQLGINPTTVGRRLTALEETIGAKLFDRTPDGYTLTPAGSDLLTHAERMESEALELERRVMGSDRRLSGVVRLTATEMLATRFIAPALGRFHERYPQLLLDLHCTNRPVSLGRREADIALRLARPREENVITRRLASIRLGLYAAEEYLARFGMPPCPDESLAGHRLILFASSRTFRLENDWLEARRDGAAIALRSDSVSSVYSAAVAGVGIALLPRSVADAEDRLTPILTRASPEPRIVWQTVHADLQHNARIRCVLEFLEKLLGGGSSRARADQGPP